MEHSWKISLNIESSKIESEEIKAYPPTSDVSPNTSILHLFVSLGEKMTAIDTTDGASSMKSFLTDSWTASNTDSKTPTIDLFDNRKSIPTAGLDFILLRTEWRGYERNAIGSTSKRKVHGVLIDIRTSISRDRALKLQGEVVRILDSGIIDPHSTNLSAGTWNWISPVDIRWKDWSDRLKGTWRITGVIEVVLATMSR